MKSSTGHKILRMVWGPILNVSPTAWTKSPRLYWAILYTVDSQTFLCPDYILIIFLPEFSVLIYQTFKMHLQHRPCSLLGCLRNSCLLLPMCPLYSRQRKAMPYHGGFPTYFLGWTNRLVSLAFETIVIALHEREYYFKECPQICQMSNHSGGPNSILNYRRFLRTGELDFVNILLLCYMVTLWMCWDSINRTRKDKED